MSLNLPESDWKLFRELREVALQRFCGRVLEDVDRARSDVSQSEHTRYLELYRLLHDRDKLMARAFNNPRRSTMIPQLALIHALSLLQTDELAQFTSATRAAAESIARDVHGPQQLGSPSNTAAAGGRAVRRGPRG